MVGKSSVASSASSSTNRSKTRVEHLGGPGVGAVDLVDDDDRPQPALERLAQHEARLRQRPLGGVDQQQGAVGHLEDALDLAAEVGVAGRVDDVDLGAADRAGRCSWPGW